MRRIHRLLNLCMHNIMYTHTGLLAQVCVINSCNLWWNRFVIMVNYFMSYTFI